MAKKEIQRIVLEEPVDVSLPDGTMVRIRPGSYNKGISIFPIYPKMPRMPGAGGSRRGRKPRASTVKLREKLVRDKADGGLRAPREYVTWLRKLDHDLTLSGARQVVYRERRVVMQEIIN